MRARAALGFAGLVALAWVALGHLSGPLLEPLEYRWFDLCQRLSLTRRPGEGIVVVALDEVTTEHLGWPLPRLRWQELLAGLSLWRPRAVGLDVFLTHHLCSPEDDSAMAYAMAGVPTYVALGLEVLQGPKSPSVLEDSLLAGFPRWEGRAVRVLRASRVVERPLKVLWDHAAGAGHVTFLPDRDGIVRRLPLVMESQGRLVPSLPLVLALQRLGQPLASCHLVPGKSLEVPGIGTIALDPKSCMILRFCGPPGTYPTFGFLELLDLMERALLEDDPVARNTLGVLRDAVVVVGITDPAQMDLSAVTVHPRFPGPELMATAVDNVLRRTCVRRVPWHGNLLAMPVLAVGGTAAALMAPWQGVATASLLAVVHAGLTAYLSSRGLWVGAMGPLVALAGSFLTVVTWERRARRREQAVVREAFGKYVSPQVFRALLEDPSKVMSCEKKLISVLFADVKGFSALCEAHDPAALLAQLNEYLAEMTETVFSYQGTVDKFMGDGLMAFFGHPLPDEHHARKAVQAAVAMQGAVARLRESWRREGKLEFHVRIGVNSGEVIAGSMGGGKKLDYTVFGSAVNLAQRLEANCDVDGVLVSEATLRLAGLDPAAAVAKVVHAKNIGDVLAYQIVLDQFPRAQGQAPTSGPIP